MARRELRIKNESIKNDVSLRDIINEELRMTELRTMKKEIKELIITELRTMKNYYNEVAGGDTMFLILNYLILN